MPVNPRLFSAILQLQFRPVSACLPTMDHVFDTMRIGRTRERTRRNGARMTHTDDTRGASRRSKAKLSALLALVLAAFFAFSSPSTFAASATNGTATATLAQSTTQTASDVAAAANPATVTVINLQQQQSPFSQSGNGDVVPAA